LRPCPEYAGRTSSTPQFVAKAQTLASAGGSGDCAGGELRSEGAYEKRVDETGRHFAHPEADAKTRLVEAKAQLVLAEAGRTESEGRLLEAERVDLEVGVYRKAAYSVVALAIFLVALVHLLFDPAPLQAGGEAGFVALLGWLAKRVGAPD
jgi:hypothetical protein